MGEGAGVGVGRGVNTLIVGEGKGIGVGIADGLIGIAVGFSAARTVNDCIIVVNMPEESRVFIVIV